MLNLLAVLSFVMILGACSKDTYDNGSNQPTPTPGFMANLSGVQETPPNSSTATGSFIASYDSYTKTLTYSITYAGLTPTAGHIHKGAVGESGPVEFTLGSVTSSPITGVITLTDAQVMDLDKGLYYVNLHTTAYPDGEIRGQIVHSK